MGLYRPIHFAPGELVGPTLLRKQGKANPEYAFWMMDERLLRTIDLLREKYGRIIINDWLWDGPNKERGFRYFQSKTGALFSQHKYGRAVDLVFVDTEVAQVQADILADPFAPAFKLINCIEVDQSWLHIDFRASDKAKHGLMVIDPRRPGARYVR